MPVCGVQPDDPGAAGGLHSGPVRRVRFRL